MITQDNFKSLLLSLGFEQNRNVLSKHFSHTEGMLKVDFNKKELIYPEDHGLIINERQTCNFSQNENFVVFECVHRLLAKGYKPEHIELEPKWKVGHGASGGRADILVKYQQGKPMLIIECKTAGKEFDKAWKDIQNDGGQLFSYAQQIQETEFLCLYASSFLNDVCVFDYYVISHKDNQKIIADDTNLLSFEKAKDVKGRFKVWQETYQLEKTTNRPRNDPRFYDGIYPFIQTGDIVRAKGNKIEYTQTLNEDGLQVSKLFQPLIVLITIAANIGDTAVLDYPACFPDSVVALIPNNDINVYFLELIMRKQKQYLNDIAPKMAQKNINIEILKSVKIPVPPLPVQEKLVSEVEKLEQEITKNQKIVDESPNLKQQVMKRYL